MVEMSDEPIELSIAENRVCFIVMKAREFDVKVDPGDDDDASNGADDDMVEVLEDQDDDLTETELRAAIDDLDDDARIDLVALCWVGRGDFERREWAAARHAVREQGFESAADYLLGIPLLGDFLEEGFEALGYSCSDIEREQMSGKRADIERDTSLD